MRKKVALTAAAVALVGTLAVGGTLAWFTDVETATNVVTMGEVDVRLDEQGGTDGVTTENGLEYTDVMPGDTFTKHVTVTNLENEAYVRTTIKVEGNEEILEAIIADTDNAIQFIGEDGAPLTLTWEESEDGYVYAEIFGEYLTDQSEVIFGEIQIPNWDNTFANKGFNIKVEVDAIQKDNFASAEEAWAAFDGVEGSNDLMDANPEIDETGSNIAVGF